MVATCGCNKGNLPGSVGILACDRNSKIIFQAISYIFPAATAIAVGIYTDFYEFFITDGSNQTKATQNNTEISSTQEINADTCAIQHVYIFEEAQCWDIV